MTDDKTPTVPPEPIRQHMPPSSAPPSSGATGKSSRDAILVSVGAAVAVIVPSSINTITSPVVKSVMALVALAVVFGLGLYTTTPASKRKL